MKRRICEYCCKQHLLNNPNHSFCIPAHKRNTLSLHKKKGIWQYQGWRILMFSAGVQAKLPTEEGKKKHKFYSRSKHGVHISSQPFDLFIYPDLDSSFPAADLVLTPSQQQIWVNQSSNCQETEISDCGCSFFSLQLLYLLKPFNTSYKLEKSHSNRSKLNSAAIYRHFPQ